MALRCTSTGVSLLGKRGKKKKTHHHSFAFKKGKGRPFREKKKVSGKGASASVSFSLRGNRCLSPRRGEGGREHRRGSFLRKKKEPFALYPREGRYWRGTWLKKKGALPPLAKGGKKCHRNCCLLSSW